MATLFLVNWQRINTTQKPLLLRPVPRRGLENQLSVITVIGFTMLRAIAAYRE
jgi:hypothetical protein